MRIKGNYYWRRREGVHSYTRYAMTDALYGTVKCKRNGRWYASVSSPLVPPGTIHETSVGTLEAAKQWVATTISLLAEP